MRKTKPTSTEQIENWAIQCAEDLLAIKETTEAKIAAAYLRGYCDCMEAMNDEHWAEIQAKARAMMAESPHLQHCEPRK